MQICKRCLYTSYHPLNITFDEEGICSGCRVHEEKDVLDWDERFTRLRSIVDAYRSRSRSNYDCVVPVSGARDSYFIVHTVKHVLKLNPLLVTYNKQYNTDVGVRNLANLRIKFDCDIMTLTVDPHKVRKITRATMRRFGSIYWHCLAGQTVFPVQIAVKFKIPLIIWGAHQGVDQVGMFSHLNEVEMTRKYRKEHDLMGYEAEDLLDEFDDIREEDIFPYIYPDNREIERVGVRGIYLNNYIRWDSKTQHEKMIDLYDYETATQTRTYDTYNDVDCWNYSDVHDYIKFIKHGYGKVVDHACRDIRLGHISRDTGIALARRYLKNMPSHLNEFLEWLGITENSFHYILDQSRNKNVWQRDRQWQWFMKQGSLFDFGSTSSDDLLPNLSIQDVNFIVTPKGSSTDLARQYILIGKGWN